MKSRKNVRKHVKVLWVLIIVAFCLIEFPGIILINRIEPRIFGFPFIYGFTLVIWLVLCILLYIGYMLKWGEAETEADKTQSADKQESEASSSVQ